MKFKVGDKVRILSRATMVGVEREEVGKIGVIICIDDNVNDHYGIMVKMDEICHARGCVPTWSIGSGMIELLPRKNEQLVFEFMIK